jgi:hypothetical protein
MTKMTCIEATINVTEFSDSIRAEFGTAAVLPATLCLGIFAALTRLDCYLHALADAGIDIDPSPEQIVETTVTEIGGHLGGFMGALGLNLNILMRVLDAVHSARNNALTVPGTRH